MEIQGDGEFLSEEETDYFEDIMEESSGTTDSNNNATVINRTSAAVPSSASAKRADQVDDQATSRQGPDEAVAGPSSLHTTFELMQDFMVKKGIIEGSMTEQQLQEFFKSEELICDKQRPQSVLEKVQPKKVTRPAIGKSAGRDELSHSSGSEVTIYKRAIKQIDLGLEEQIEDFINKS